MHIEKFLPREIDENWLLQNLGGVSFKLNNNIYKDLLVPVWDLLGRGGKRWRPVLMILCCDVMDGGSKVLDFIPLIELVHNGTLIIDDIEDDSLERRRGLCIHRKYGVDVAVNAGNMLYFLPSIIIRNSKLDRNLKLRIYDVWSEELLKLHIGQGLDIDWHNCEKCPTEKAYLQMCAFKTGVLARLAAKLGALFGNATVGQINAIGRFAESIGIAFQIQDDILNLKGDCLGKGYGDDIVEGKKTLMVIRVMEIGEEKDRMELMAILRNGTDVNGAISIFDKYRAVEYAKTRSCEIVQNAWDNLEPILRDGLSKDKLRDFAEFVTERKI